ncbi:MAG: bifunctional glutamate N-acetyltransferase/amino-acid acetyltransferase ArgJ [Candidatus Caenarcaniphilales bacterium]|nr:bifunctional glutamate N-acetyltransferase/amino-acid acetyltransferase ArgJ [Candidatus Caenarcaniphilales bacterium]
MLPRKFLSVGMHSGIKKDSSQKDLGVIFSDQPCKYAAVFTQNSVKAHCVIDNKNVLLSSPEVNCIVVNSGNANACTGTEGSEAVKHIKNHVAAELNLEVENILTASTGVIGRSLDSHLICSSLQTLKAKFDSSYIDFAESILTTDTKIKTYEKELNGCKIVGIAKGSGMIHPDMATMLAFIVTDASIGQDDLQECLNAANAKSFNQISVDGDTSTNDMVILLANGASNEEVNLQEFRDALNDVCMNLAKQIVSDGEGATKLIEVSVRGAQTEKEAAKIAKGIASSSLVKSAIFGADPNWGRIVSAAGQNGSVDIEKISLKILEENLIFKGKVQEVDLIKLSQAIKENNEIKVELDLEGNTDISTKAWGCDLTYDYVKINAEYTT